VLAERHLQRSVQPISFWPARAAARGPALVPVGADWQCRPGPCTGAMQCRILIEIQAKPKFGATQARTKEALENRLLRSVISLRQLRSQPSHRRRGGVFQRLPNACAQLTSHRPWAPRQSPGQLRSDLKSDQTLDRPRPGMDPRRGFRWVLSKTRSRIPAPWRLSGTSTEPCGAPGDGLKRVHRSLPNAAAVLAAAPQRPPTSA
jgi:hypothetical protein